MRFVWFAVAQLTKFWFGDVGGIDRFKLLCPSSDEEGDAGDPIAGVATHWGGTPLPNWAVDPTAARLVPALDDEGFILPHCLMAFLAAQAWKYVFVSAMMLWSGWVLLPIFVSTPYATAMATCDAVGGLARLPWLWTALFLPIVVVALALEAKAHSWISPAVCQLGTYKLPLLGEVKQFWMYFGALLVVSLSGHLDLFTNGLFFVRLRTSENCPGNQVEAIWREVVRNSAIPFLPSITTLSMLTWLAMAPQLMVGLGYGVPNTEKVFRTMFSPCKTKSIVRHFASLLPPSPSLSQQSRQSSQDEFDKESAASGNEGYCDPMLALQIADCPLFEYSTLFGAKCSADHMMLALAEVSRMNLVTFRAYNHVKVLVSFLGPLSGAGDAGGVVIPLSQGTSQLMTRLLQREVRRVCLYMLLEVALQANVQASVLGINKAIHKEPDRLTQCSVVLTFLMGCYNLVAAAQRMNTMGKYIFGFSGFADWMRGGERDENPEQMDDEQYAALDDKNDVYIKEFEDMKKSVVWSILEFLLFAILAFVLLVYAFVKVVKASTCPQGVWNLSGCVQLDLNTHQ